MATETAAREEMAAREQERARIMTLSKKWQQDKVSSPCTTRMCTGRLLVIGNSGGGVCGASISVDIEYAQKCPVCFATAKSYETLRDCDF
jgi:hypothetical protein